MLSPNPPQNPQFYPLTPTIPNSNVVSCIGFDYTALNMGVVVAQALGDSAEKWKVLSSNPRQTLEGVRVR